MCWCHCEFIHLTLVFPGSSSLQSCQSLICLVLVCTMAGWWTQQILDNTWHWLTVATISLWERSLMVRAVTSLKKWKKVSTECIKNSYFNPSIAISILALLCMWFVTKMVDTSTMTIVCLQNQFDQLDELAVSHKYNCPIIKIKTTALMGQSLDVSGNLCQGGPPT